MQRINRFLHRVGRSAREHAAYIALDAFAIAGASLITSGVGQIYSPAGLITGGLFLLTFGIWGSRCLAASSRRYSESH